MEKEIQKRRKYTNNSYKKHKNQPTKINTQHNIIIQSEIDEWDESAGEHEEGTTITSIKAGNEARRMSHQGN